MYRKNLPDEKLIFGKGFSVYIFQLFSLEFLMFLLCSCKMARKKPERYVEQGYVTFKLFSQLFLAVNRRRNFIKIDSFVSLDVLSIFIIALKLICSSMKMLKLVVELFSIYKFNSTFLFYVGKSF